MEPGQCGRAGGVNEAGWMMVLRLGATRALVAPPSDPGPTAEGVGSMTIEGGATCPTAAEVALRFSSLLPPSSASAVGVAPAGGDNGDRARIDMVDEAVGSVLRSPAGTGGGRR